ncbi:hypothetical protein IAQ61_006256 [Plenodomus lingam]|uniref:FAM192A/Fyv6 N-terminal domain-containing protein n=1 Tax=Leptosphaeria maculans (strain JN3 / isolate v23.1.3 / race Av1-4-5-6-7-8) TaxID=985895 RepID=E4ZM04_LEPMJ|nr:hypothetical protein LEMA_P050590.1 [Plenodomus lingam JN3]KAH9870777.1 hypothetical protein IAQ61_006256 [Plenodomus lingam]CBX92353.1 hypothetical protein LEMA_P050590.1 [Plenodomus lingam JN3]
MSSGFVSGGTAGEEVERNDEWKRAQREIEEARKAKADLAKQQDGKSLFEILQANKDKKQAEFEEKARFKLHNALDDDEADYLDSILEKKRQEEIRIKKETLAQLDLFRTQQEETERRALEAESVESTREDQQQWAIKGRKRKHGSEAGFLKGVKLRKSSPVREEHEKLDKMTAIQSSAPQSNATSSMPQQVSAPRSLPTSSSAKLTNTLSLGLGYTSSDEED